MNADLHLCSGLEQADLLRAREVSSVELLDHQLARIAKHQPQLWAFTEVNAFRARRAAARCDRRLRRGGDLPIFLGVPSAIKDSDPVRFTRTRAGSRAYRYVVAPFDSPSAARFREAGFVFAGKTTASELALMPVTEPDIHPPTRNPWNRSHSSGGSSGGAAAAVAARLLPLAHAADGGGSIRIPANFSHLFGFKSSRALPNFYANLEPLHMASVGAMTHTVDDAAAILDVLSGDPRFPHAEGSYLQRSRRPVGRALRIGILTESPLAEVDAEIQEAVRRVGRTLEALGHDIEPVGPIDGTLEAFLPIYQRLAAAPPVLLESVLQPVTRWLRDPGKSVSLGQAQAAKDGLQRRILTWFGDLDALICPSAGKLTPKVGAWRSLPPAEQFAKAVEVGAFTAAFNVSGQPGANVPAGFSADGLPLGVQVVGPPRADALVLQLCRQLEEAMPWRDRVAVA